MYYCVVIYGAHSTNAPVMKYNHYTPSKNMSSLMYMLLICSMLCSSVGCTSFNRHLEYAINRYAEPWTAIILREGEPICKATLISRPPNERAALIEGASDVLLTAASCVTEVGRSSGILVSSDYKKFSTLFNKDEDFQMEIKFANIIVHRKYGENQLGLWNDIAMVKLENPINFNMTLKLIYGLSDNVWLEDLSNCTIPGLGKHLGNLGYLNRNMIPDDLHPSILNSFHQKYKMDWLDLGEPVTEVFFAQISLLSMVSAGRSAGGSAAGALSNAEILTRLRTLMSNFTTKSEESAENLSAYIIPSVDQHQSEYIADRDQRLRFVSNFSGSRGLAVVTLNQAALWTDGRYFLQAEKQLDPKFWTLMKEGQPETPTVADFLKKNLPPNSLVGLDPKLTSYSFYEDLRRNILSGRLTIRATEENLVDQVWGQEQPAMPKNPLLILPISYAGLDWRQKIRQVRQQMIKYKAGLLILSALDDIAWLFNLRGQGEIKFNPVFFSFAVLGQDFVKLYLDQSKITKELEDHLSAENSTVTDDNPTVESVEILPYENFYPSLREIVDRFENDDNATTVNNSDYTQIWTPSNSANMAIWLSVKNESRRLDKMSPVQILKAIKNPTELMGLRNAQIKDGVAHCQFFHWLENRMTSSLDNDTNNSTNELINEISVADKFEYFRSKQQDFMGLSFDTISSVGPNSAIIHYKPTVESNTVLSRDQVYLIDSGSQFKDGTTDITRTISFNEPDPYVKECFTRVLKGHINLAKMKFPEGTNGFLIDSAARVALWDVGLDYLHGTGHGVGHFLNVHEGPAGLGTRASQYTDGLKENMIMTIEPGYYEDGKFGIRIESDFVIKAVETKYKFKDKKMLTFEPLTLVPIQRQMIDASILNDDEKKWLNDYHKKCLDVLGPILDQNGDFEVLEWLKNSCKTL